MEKGHYSNGLQTLNFNIGEDEYSIAPFASFYAYATPYVSGLLAKGLIQKVPPLTAAGTPIQTSEPLSSNAGTATAQPANAAVTAPAAKPKKKGRKTKQNLT